MALILDTRFLIAHAFPPSDEERRSVFPLKDIKGEVADPSIAIVEFIKVAGTRLGAEQAGIKLKLWIARGAGVLSVDEETAFLAGKLALRHRDVPMADVIIGALAKQHKAAVITDDPHFKTLNIKTVWYK